MTKIHDKYVIELKEVIKVFGNDPQVKDPFRFPCDYKFYEIDGVAICENSFKKMKQLEDVAIPKDQYEARLKADLVAMLTELQLDIEEQEMAIHTDKEVWNNAIAVCSEVIQEKIKTLTENKDGTDEKTSD